LEIPDFIKSIKGLSENTRRNYQASLDLLARWIAGPEPTAEEIEAWLNTYDKASTLQRHKAAVNCYWRWRFKGKDNQLPFDRYTFHHSKKKIPQIMMPDTAEAIIDRCQDPDDVMFLRSLYMFGCRIRELLRTKLTDFVETGATMTVKGGNEQIKVVSPEFLAELRAYVGKRDGVMFPRGYDYYYTLIKRLGAAVGHPEAHPHGFRHARAINLADNGKDATYIADFLGHSNLATVMIYLKLSKQGLQSRLPK